MKIKFTDVGRDKWNGIIEVPDTDDAEAIAEYGYREAKKYLVSRFPDTVYNSETNEGLIYSGMYNVGKFEVVKNAE